jgi:hypothetical protein
LNTQLVALIAARLPRGRDPSRVIAIRAASHGCLRPRVLGGV